MHVDCVSKSAIVILYGVLLGGFRFFGPYKYFNECVWREGDRMNAIDMNAKRAKRMRCGILKRWNKSASIHFIHCSYVYRKP